MTKPNLNAHRSQWSRFLKVGIASLAFGAAPAFAREPMDATILESFRSMPSRDFERAAEAWAGSCATAEERSDAANELVMILAENPMLSDRSSLIRKFGLHLEPEFTAQVLAQIQATRNPVAIGSLLSLLRDSPPETADALTGLLSDTRAAEDLEELSQVAPKIGEAIANGAVEFRVCDIAFNVIQELREEGGTRAQMLTRSGSISSRNETIKKITGIEPPTRDPRSSASRRSPEKSSPLAGEPASEPSSSSFLLKIASAAVVVAGLLWQALKPKRAA